MLKYLIVILDNTSVSFCHYDNNHHQRRLISKDYLEAGVLWAMKENLMVQFVYPDYEIPIEYLKIIDSVDHIDITSSSYEGDVTVFSGISSASRILEFPDENIILRLPKDELLNEVESLVALINSHKSLRIVITDIQDFSEEDLIKYKSVLSILSKVVESKLSSGRNIQFSLLTDRIQLNSMNNCDAGVESITLAPDGNFYICPAFYFDGQGNVGNPNNGLNVPNENLLTLEYAPICRKCDAYHCKRCVWLNQKTTLEVNTPSHQQCVVAHLERNEARRLLYSLKRGNKINSQISIPEIDYLDPFEKIAK